MIKQIIKIQEGQYDYQYIDISPEHKAMLQAKAEDWKRLVEKYKIKVNNLNGGFKYEKNNY